MRTVLITGVVALGLALPATSSAGTAATSSSTVPSQPSQPTQPSQPSESTQPPTPGSLPLPAAAEQLIRVSIRPTHDVMPSVVVDTSGRVFLLENQGPSLLRASHATHGATHADSHAHSNVGVNPAPRAMLPLPPPPQPMAVRQLTPAGLQQLMRRARELGMTDVRDFAQVGVTDQATTYIEVGGVVNSVYALGFDDESDPARRAAYQFVNELMHLDQLVGAEIGPAQRYQPLEFYVRDAYSYNTSSSPLPSWPEEFTNQRGCMRLPLARFMLPIEGIYSLDRPEVAEIAVLPALPGGPCGESLSLGNDASSATQP